MKEFLESRVKKESIISFTSTSFSSLTIGVEVCPNGLCSLAGTRPLKGLVDDPPRMRNAWRRACWPIEKGPADTNVGNKHNSNTTVLGTKTLQRELIVMKVWFSLSKL